MIDREHPVDSIYNLQLAFERSGHVVNVANSFSIGSWIIQDSGWHVSFQKLFWQSDGSRRLS